jgi:hypothetical protein
METSITQERPRLMTKLNPPRNEDVFVAIKEIRKTLIREELNNIIGRSLDIMLMSACIEKMLRKVI